MVIAVVVAAIAVSALLGRPISAWSTSPVMAYIPPSGTRVVLQGSDASDTVDEYFAGVGFEVMASGPAAAHYAAGGGTGAITSTTWVRLREVTAGADGGIAEQLTQFFAATPTGLELRVGAWAKTFVAFRPGLPVLPVAVTDGQHWTATGTAVLGAADTISGTEPYTAGFTAATGEAGCVTVARSLTLGTGSTASTEQSSATWCPGRGITAAADDARTAAAVDRPPVWTGPARDHQPKTPDLGVAWRFARRDLNGLPPLTLSSNQAPAVLPGPVVVSVNTPGNDLVARGWDDGTADARWVAHPGGQVTAVASVGRVVVAATSLRQLVGYGEHGEYLWQAALGDVSAVPIAVLGPLAIVATLDGQITAFRASDGTVAWRSALDTQILQPMVVDGSTAAVIDQAGTVRVFDAGGSTVSEASTVVPEAFTVTSGVAVVASQADRYVRAFRLADGRQLWRVEVPGNRKQIVGAGDLVAVRTLDTLTALRLSDGSSAWAKDLAGTSMLAQDGSLVVTDHTTVHRFAPDGSSLGAFVTQEKDLSFGPGAVLALADGSLLVFFNATVYRLGGE
ncbi:PQQ-binding-like beta-propeller repeat protein [Micropruina sp.]|uniref:outer membrane protein assembly factor BamB family protein n=1 Tax=Micropruina sp. TaxID=2737536 RepID=UPI0039E41114